MFLGCLSLVFISMAPYIQLPGSQQDHFKMYAYPQRQKEPKQTCTLTSHISGKPTFLCLDKNCVNERLLCSNCSLAHNDQRHTIILVNNIVDPFSRLSINRSQENSRDIYKDLNGRIRLIEKSIKKVQMSANQFFDDIRNTMLEPLVAIAGTFSPRAEYQALGEIGKDQPNAEEVEAIANRINFLRSNEADTDNFEQREMKADQTLCFVKKKVNQLLEHFQKKEVNAPKNELYQKRTSKAGQKKEPDSIKSHNSHKSDDAIVPEQPDQPSAKKSVKQRIQVVADTVKVETTQKDVHQHRKRSVEAKQGDRPIRQQKLKVKRLKNMKRERSQMISEEVKAEEPIREQIMPKHESMKVEETLIKRQLETLHEEEICIVDSQHAIASIPHENVPKIKSLTVESFRSQPSQFFTKLSHMKNLRTIRVFDRVICEQPNALTLLQSLPASIQEIYLNCSNDFDIECVNELAKKEKMKIRKIQYFYELASEMRRFDEDLYIRVNEKGVRVEPICFKDVNTMADKFPFLVNCWIRINNFKTQRKPFSIKFQQLQSLILGELLDSNDKMEMNQIPVRLGHQILTQARRLQTIALLGLNMTTKFFVDLIAHNRELQTLYCELCKGPTEEAMHQIIQTNTKIKNFSLKECREIKGGFIQEVPHAEIFILDLALLEGTEEYKKMEENTFNSLQRNNSFAYVNNYGNPFFTDSLLATMKNSFHCLKSLNIGFTCVTNDCVEVFKQMGQLECLVLDDNILSTEGLYRICQFLPQLTKLSLCGYNGDKNKGEVSAYFLNCLGTLLPNLQCLSIRNCCKVDSNQFKLSNFPKLRTVDCDRQVGVQFIASLITDGLTVLQDDGEMFSS